MFRKSPKTLSVPSVARPTDPEPVAVELNSEGTATSAQATPAEVSRLPPSPPRGDSKLGIVLGLLQADEGVSLAKLVAVTDWQPHTTRAALTGLRKRGYLIAMDKVVDTDGAKRSVYRVSTEQVR